MRFIDRFPATTFSGRCTRRSDLEGAKQRLRDFLIFRFGGPQTYVEQRGHPRLRIRHAPFAIGQAARDRWLQLMTRALDEAALPAEPRQILQSFFESTTTFLQERAGRLISCKRPPAKIDSCPTPKFSSLPCAPILPDTVSRRLARPPMSTGFFRPIAARF